MKETTDNINFSNFGRTRPCNFSYNIFYKSGFLEKGERKVINNIKNKYTDIINNILSNKFGCFFLEYFYFIEISYEDVSFFLFELHMFFLKISNYFYYFKEFVIGGLL